MRWPDNGTLLDFFVCAESRSMRRSLRFDLIPEDLPLALHHSLNC